MNQLVGMIFNIQCLMSHQHKALKKNTNNYKNNNNKSQ